MLHAADLSGNVAVIRLQQLQSVCVVTNALRLQMISPVSQEAVCTSCVVMPRVMAGPSKPW